MIYHPTFLMPTDPPPPPLSSFDKPIKLKSLESMGCLSAKKAFSKIWRDQILVKNYNCRN